MVAGTMSIDQQTKPNVFAGMTEQELIDLAFSYTEEEWLASAAQDDLINFCEFTKDAYQASAHHRLIAQKLMAVERGEIDRLIIVVPPQHGKSELASIRFPAWFLGRNPRKRVMACSYGLTLARDFSYKSRNVMADANRWPFPNVRLADDRATSTEWDTDQGGGYSGSGMRGVLTGKGCDLLVIDDAVKGDEAADSPTQRDATWEWYTSTAYPRVRAGGAIVVIGTRWNQDDLIGRLLDAQENGGDQWEVLHLPAICDSEDDPLGRKIGEVLWPEVYTAEEINKKKANMSGRMFTAQYQGRPTELEGGTFKETWWQRYTPQTLPKMAKAEILVDSAFKTGVANDYSVFALWGTDGLGKAYLLHVWRGKWEFPDLIRKGHEVHEKAKNIVPEVTSIPLVVEDKASGQSAIQTWRKPQAQLDRRVFPALPVVAYKLPPGSSKESRAEGVTGMVEGGQAFIPVQAPWLKDWLEEHNTFPNGRHDDSVDTTSMALPRLLRKQGGGVI